MFKRYATATVVGAEIARRDAFGLVKTSHRAVFDYEPREGFLYVRSRMISSRCNDNHDEFPAEEIRKAWKTAVGKPVFVNHANEDHRRMRGVIVDAALHEDVLPDGKPDVWIEALHEIDARRFPKLAQAILEGRVNRTSMGTDVGFSVCSACGNKASTPAEYCDHIPRMKGKILYRHTASGEREGHLIREICYKLGFFENSFLVEDPADPTAVVTGIDDRGLKSTASLVKEATPEGLRFHFTPAEYHPDRYHHLKATLPGEDGRRDVGYLSWHPGNGTVMMVQTDDRERGQGIASALWHRAHEVAGQQDLVPPRHSDVQTPDGIQWAHKIDQEPISAPGSGQQSLFEPTIEQGATEVAGVPRPRHDDLFDHLLHDHAEWGRSSVEQMRDRGSLESAHQRLHDNATMFPGRHFHIHGMRSSLPKVADYHVRCDREGCHSPHWGPYGAAGLLVRHHDPEDGQTRYLLQKRAPWVDHGDTWGIPGGALHEDETPREGAEREAEEEMGGLPDGLTHHKTHTDDHGGWAYHTVVLDAPEQFHPTEWDDESTGHGWFTKPEMKNMDLHPGFAQSLHAVTGGDEAHGPSHEQMRLFSALASSLPSIEAVRYDKPTDHPFFQDNKLSPRHIVAAYDEADEPTKAQGMRWYSDAHHIAKSLDPDGDAHRGAGVLAAYSPRSAWPINLFNASNTLKNRRAVRIGEGMNVMGQHAKSAAKLVEDNKHYFQVFSTPKITDFAHLIAHAGDDDSCPTCKPHKKDDYPKQAVVVDRHALSVAAGRRMNDNDLGRAPLGTRKYYEHVADQYRRAARQISKRDGTTVHPHQLQAITWLQQQKRNAAADEGESFGGRGRQTRDRNAWSAWEQHATDTHPGLMGEEGNIHLRNPHRKESSLPVLAFRKGAPFAGYDDFEDCTEKNSDKDDPDAYCGEVKHRTEGSRSSLPSVTAYGETKAPQDVDTLRTESCPVCGEADAFDGDRCQVCNFIQPPAMFTDPDTGVAKQMDLKKDTLDQQSQVGPDGQPIPGQDEVDPNDPNGENQPMTDMPGMAEDQIADLFCPACGFSADTQEPMTNNDPSMPPEQQGLMEGDVCPNCGQATMLSPNDVGEMGGEVPQEVADDANANGIPDDQEQDVDGDGIPDTDEPDVDNDGKPDDSERDSDDDGTPDDADPDDDDPAVPDPDAAGGDDDPGADEDADPVEDDDEAPKGRKDNARRA